MRRFPINFLLVGIAIALLPAHALAGPDLDEAAIEAAIPVPEPVNLPPPTIADFGPIAQEAGSTAEAAKTAAPIPGSANPALPKGADSNESSSASIPKKDGEAAEELSLLSAP